MRVHPERFDSHLAPGPRCLNTLFAFTWLGNNAHGDSRSLRDRESGSTGEVSYLHRQRGQMPLTCTDNPNERSYLTIPRGICPPKMPRESMHHRLEIRSNRYSRDDPSGLRRRRFQPKRNIPTPTSMNNSDSFKIPLRRFGLMG